MTVAHQHAHHSGADLLRAARDVLTATGEQWTEMRTVIFETLVDAANPVSAYDVAERVGVALGRRIAPNSVYRILDLFVSHNIALRVESRNAYIANPHPGCVHDCIFLVCDNCDKTYHVDDDAIGRALRKAAAVKSFTVQRPVIEVRGRCENCSRAS